MTIDAYKTLYDSSVTFGVRKQLQAEQGMSEMEGKIKSLNETKKSLENQVLELRNRVDVIEKREQERRQAGKQAMQHKSGKPGKYIFFSFEHPIARPGRPSVYLSIYLSYYY